MYVRYADARVNGIVNLGMNVDGKVWKKDICERIQGFGCIVWKGGFNESESEK